MTVAATGVACPYCEQAHGPEVLCPPARRVLDALHARGLAFTGVHVNLPEPVSRAEALGLQPQDSIAGVLSVTAGTVEISPGIHRPLLALSGITWDGTPLPRWMYAADDDGMQRLVHLVATQARGAVERAALKRMG